MASAVSGALQVDGKKPAVSLCNARTKRVPKRFLPGVTFRVALGLRKLAQDLRRADFPLVPFRQDRQPTKSGSSHSKIRPHKPHAAGKNLTPKWRRGSARRPGRLVLLARPSSPAGGKNIYPTNYRPIFRDRPILEKKKKHNYFIELSNSTERQSETFSLIE